MLVAHTAFAYLNAQIARCTTGPITSTRQMKASGASELIAWEQRERGQKDAGQERERDQAGAIHLATEQHADIGSGGVSCGPSGDQGLRVGVGYAEIRERRERVGR